MPTAILPPAPAPASRPPPLLLVGNGLTPVADALQTTDGWRLRHARGRYGPAAEWGCYALVWNLGLVVAVLALARDFHDGQEWVAAAVAVVLAGLGVLLARAWWWRMAAAVVTPPFALTIDAPQVVRGRAAVLHWECRDGRRRAVRVALVLHEECETTAGTEYLFDRCEVRAVPAVGSTGDGDGGAAAGTCTVAVPEDLPPSFSGSATQLLWCVRVQWADGRKQRVAHYPLRVVLAEAGPVARIACLPLPVAAEVATDAGEASLVLDRLDGDAGAGTDEPIRGIARVPGRAARLRLRWQATGKGDLEKVEVASVLLPPGGAAFAITLPATPPAWHGAVAAIIWMAILEEDDGRMIAWKRVSGPRTPGRTSPA